jgi:hypothetical protein
MAYRFSTPRRSKAGAKLWRSGWWGVLSVVLLMITPGCLTGFEKGSGDGSTDPVSLLADHPALPRSLLEFPLSPIRWRRVPLPPHIYVFWCKFEASGFREWTLGGEYAGSPSVDQDVCVFADEDGAADAYGSMSLGDVAGEDWPNFERGSDVETSPRRASELDDLAADEWEIGCGDGDADGSCSVWDFRARYGNVLTSSECFSQGAGGGIDFSSMSKFIRSIDRHLAANAPKPNVAAP